MAVTANPNIIMGFRAPEIQNPMALAAQGEQIRSARNQNAMAEATLAAAPAKAAQELKQTMLGNVKDIVGTSATAEEANAKIRSLGGGADTTEFEFTSPEHFGSVKNTLFPQRQGDKPVDQEMRDARLELIRRQTELYGQGKAITPEQQRLLDLKAKSLEGTIKANEAKLAPSPESVFEANDAINTIKELSMDDSGFDQIYGTVAGRTPDVRQSSVDAAARRDNLVSLLQMASRGKLKGQGPISDTETKMLAQSATILSNPLISAEAARAELKRITPLFERMIAKGTPQLPPTNAQGWKLHKNKATGEQAYIGPNGEIERAQ